MTTAHGVFSAKAPTTPSDQSVGVLTAASAALEAAELRPTEIGAFVHGMTVTTNAMLEGRFARTALLTTKGFSDLEELGRQNRADLYRLEVARPRPIVPPELRFGLDERCGPDGVITALDREGTHSAIVRAAELGAEAIAVCLLFSFRHPEHELAVREIAAEAAPGLHVSLSHETVGSFREFERCATTIADAALCPQLSGYLAKLSERAAGAGLPAPQVILSNGGVVPAQTAARNASWTLLSGPAGGAVAAARSAKRLAAPRAIAFDMGGTSTDVSLVADGGVAVAAEREVAGRPLALPAVDISTVGAGGGSIAWRDSGGALRVGPQSAGAMPGPASYGHGGREATVTDANLLLGRLAEDSPLAGGLALDREAAEAAVTRLGAELGLSTLETAAGIVDVANLEMLRATTAVTVNRGVDPREHALIAFGGAGPMHAVAIAEQLGVTRVICPVACGVLSAWGIAVAGRRRDRSRSIVRALDDLDAAELTALEHELAAAAAADLDVAIEEATVTRSYDLRYRGQAFELPVQGDHAGLAGGFHTAHEDRFGFCDRNAAVELVTVRVCVAVEATGRDALPVISGVERELPPREAFFAGSMRPARVFGALPAGGPPLRGPLLIDQPQATIVVPPGWTARDQSGDIVIEQETRS